MSAPGEAVRTVSYAPLSHVSWPAIFVGAIAAAGISLTLHAFAAGIGLSVLSASPTWREGSAWLSLLAGIYVVFVALCAFGLGGYITGRMRTPLSLTVAEMEFRDGLSGVIMWGLAVVLTAMLTLGAAGVIGAKTGGQNDTVTAGESALAPQLDMLFRTGHVIPDDIAYRRAEVSRILLKTTSSDGVTQADRDYLTGVTAAIAMVPENEASARVNRAVTQAKDALHQTRVAAVLQAFFIAAALMIGAAVSWFAAVEGGHDRETGRIPVWEWEVRRKSA